MNRLVRGCKAATPRFAARARVQATAAASSPARQNLFMTSSGERNDTAPFPRVSNLWFLLSTFSWDLRGNGNHRPGRQRVLLVNSLSEGVPPGHGARGAG